MAEKPKGPDYVIRVDPPVSPEVLEDIRRQWEHRYSSRPIILVGPGLTFTRIGWLRRQLFRLASWWAQGRAGV